MDPKPNQNKLIQTMSVPWLRKKKEGGRPEIEFLMSQVT